MSLNEAETIIRESVDSHVRNVMRRSEFRDDLDDLLNKFDGLHRLIQSGDSSSEEKLALLERKVKELIG